MKLLHKEKNLDFKVDPTLLALAYQGDANALYEIGKQALNEQRLGLAQNFFRLANKHRNQHDINRGLS